MESLMLRALRRDLAPLAGRTLGDVGPGPGGRGLALTIGAARLLLLPDGPGPSVRLPVAPGDGTDPFPTGAGRRAPRPARRAGADFEWTGAPELAEIGWHLGTRAGGGRLASVRGHGLARILVLEFERKDRYGDPQATSLVVEIFGLFVDLVVVDARVPGGRILARLKGDRRPGASARTERGRDYAFPPRDRVDLELDGAGALAARLSGPGPGAPGRAGPPAGGDDPGWSARLAAAAEGLSPLVAAEVVARAGAGLAPERGEGDVLTPESREGDALTRERLVAAWGALIEAVDSSPEPGLFRPERGAARPLPFRPIALPGRFEPCDGVAAALEAAAGEAAARSGPSSAGAAPGGKTGALPRREALAARLAARLAPARKLPDQLRTERTRHADAETPRRRAETLLAAADRVERGAPEVTLPAADGDGTLTIPLDPARSAVENAERWFREARKARQAAERLPREIARAESAVARYEGWLERLDGLAASDEAGLAELAGEIDRREGTGGRRDGSARGGPAAGAGGTGPRGDGPHRGREPLPAVMQPRRYRLPGGWLALVGRSQAANDYLTHRLAEPHDLWFHAHGCPGSHVVLKGPDRKSQPDRAVIEAAAALAALHSKARHAGRVPVIYAEKRHVRKPRGAKPGLASVTNEKSVMVKPAEPVPPVEDE